MKKRQLKSLPVLMHHLVSNDASHLSVRPAVFEEQCRSLAEKGWFGIGLAEAEEFLINGAPLPEKSFLMTELIVLVKSRQFVMAKHTMHL